MNLTNCILIEWIIRSVAAKVLVKWLKAVWAYVNLYPFMDISFKPSVHWQCHFFIVASTMSHHRNVTCSVQHSASYKPLCSVNIHFPCIIYEVIISFWSIEWIICFYSLVKALKTSKRRKTKMTRWSHECFEVPSVCCNYPSVLVILMFHCDKLKRNLAH